MTQYLYGAAVQGIQGFIFQTNRLREIVGASELVEQICTSLFRDMVGADFSDNNLIIGAAGNIKYIFDSREECERVVEGFPKMVMELAPGITVSQAVVALESDLRSSDIQELERRLKIQRNRPMPQLNLASMSMERSRRTGGAGVEYRKGEVIDLPTLKKLDESDSSTMRLLGKILTQQGVDYARDLNELVDQGEDNSYIAVIHADGNGLGAILQQLGDSVTKRYPTKVKEAFKSFSLALDRATVEAAKSAFELTYVGVERDRVKLRPVILGGDDLTVICDAKHALAFTHHFLSEFERHTRMEFERSLSEFNLKQTHLTACAGVAFVKSSYPFHYAIKLAEALCAESKVESKSRAARAGIDLAASSYL
ncbi:MAG: Cas10/Cmr2 second palm domain-containing protein, partial [Bacteroidales bacterium]